MKVLEAIVQKVWKNKHVVALVIASILGGRMASIYHSGGNITEEMLKQPIPHISIPGLSATSRMNLLTNREISRISPDLVEDLEVKNQAPCGLPIQLPEGYYAVISQEWGVGTHSPAAIWGGVDIGANRTGANDKAQPDATAGLVAISNIDGIATVKPDSWPGGNVVIVKNSRYKILFAHLNSFLIKDGDSISPGTPVGIVGTTGNSTGPHLHFETWEDGVNVNPRYMRVLDDINDC